MAISNFKQFLAAGARECDACGIVKSRDGVNQLDRLSLGIELVEQIVQVRGEQTLLVHADETDVSADTAEIVQGAHVGRILGDDHVTRVDDGSDDQVDGAG